MSYFRAPKTRRDARVVEEARLESVYTPKGYPGFESPSLRKINLIKLRQETVIKVLVSFFFRLKIDFDEEKLYFCI